MTSDGRTGTGLNHADLRYYGEKRMRRYIASEVSPDSATIGVAHAISPPGVTAGSLMAHPASSSLCGTLPAVNLWTAPTSSSSSYLLENMAIRPNLSFDLPVRNIVLSADMMKAASAIAAASTSSSVSVGSTSAASIASVSHSPSSSSSSSPSSSADAVAIALASMASPTIAASHVGPSSLVAGCERRAIVRLGLAQSRHTAGAEDLALNVCEEEEESSDDDSDDDNDSDSETDSQASQESDGVYDSDSQLDDSDDGDDDDEHSDDQGSPHAAQRARTTMRAPRPNQHAASYGIRFSWDAAIQEAKDEAAAALLKRC